MNINDGHRISGGVGYTSEGTPLSPIEVSPTTVELPPAMATTTAAATSTVESQPRSSYAIEMDQIEKQIVQNLAELNASSDIELSDNDDVDNAATTPVDRRSSVDPDAEWKKRVMLQPHCLQTRRSDVSDELVGKVSSSAAAAATAAQANIDSGNGACQSRPADLPLFDDATGRPIPPPRQHSSSARNQRLLSVPNIKYNRSISENARIKAPRKEPISIAANLMRRFSKYLHLATGIHILGTHTNQQKQKCDVHTQYILSPHISTPKSLCFALAMIFFAAIENKTNVGRTSDVPISRTFVLFPLARIFRLFWVHFVYFIFIRFSGDF